MSIAPTAASGRKSQKRVFELDLLRFFAAAAVMVYHYTYHFADSGVGDPGLSVFEVVTRHGYLGVDVFFIISGFVVLWSALGRTPTSFARARVLRLYPEFWISVFVSLFVFKLVPGGSGAGLTAGDVVANLTMVPGYLGADYVDGVYWTLAVEIKFYALIWLLLIFRQLERAELWLYVWLGLTALQTVTDLGGALGSLTMFPFAALFASGGLFYFVFDSGWTWSRVAGLSVGLVLSSYHAIQRMGGFIDTPHITTAAQIVTVVVLVGAFAFFTIVGKREASAGFVRFAATAGGLTYPLYLLHNVGKEIFLTYPGARLPEPIAFMAAVLLSLAISYVVLRLGTGIGRALLKQAWDQIFGVQLPKLVRRSARAP